MAPSRGCGGTVCVEAGAEMNEQWDSVDVVKCRLWCCSARCRSACDSCDGSCGVEGQQLEEGPTHAPINCKGLRLDTGCKLQMHAGSENSHRTRPRSAV